MKQSDKNAFISNSHAKKFDIYRKLEHDIIWNWVSKIAELKENLNSSIEFIVDAGAGTGRFSIPFAEKFSDLEVIAVDKSEQMLERLNEKILDGNIQNLRTKIGEISDLTINANGIGIIFISEVLHLINNLENVINLFYRGLIDNGYFVIRTTSHEQLKNIEWLQFFEGALEYDLKRTTDVNVIIEHLEKVGFKNIIVETIDESQTFESHFYYKMLEEKAYSILYSLDSFVLDNGFKKLFEHCQQNTTCLHTIKTTRIIAKK